MDYYYPEWQSAGGKTDDENASSVTSGQNETFIKNSKSKVIYSVHFPEMEPIFDCFSADIYILLNYSKCFGRPLCPSSGVHKNVVAASGTDHTEKYKN
jgi:hypothetical protein